jgi:cystathionine beta-synthase
MESFLANRPDAPSRCTYTVNGDRSKCPHHLEDRQKSIRQKVYDNVLELIGDTPLVRINRLGRDSGVKCNLLAKLEFFNAGGSVKDRIGLRMVEEAERDGTLKPGDTVIEPTSGNTGIGLALACAVKNYRCIIVMPEKMSKEKVDVLRALGAEIIRTPTSAAFDAPESHIGVAHRLKMKIPNSHILDQYRNPYNPIAHYDTTAEEILVACNGKVDMVVAGAGTGGTLTGLSRKLKEKCPDCIIVGVDPEGSILAVPESMNKTGITFYEVEGIGYDFIPTVLDRSLVDRWYKSSDLISLKYSRRLIKEEGMLCGASSGSAMSCAIQACKDFKLTENQTCVVILPDSVRNYMTKFLSDDWMIERDFLDIKDQPNSEWWHAMPVSSIKIREPVTVSTGTTIQSVLDIMHERGFDQVPVISDDGTFMGMTTMCEIMAKMSRGTINAQDPISKAVTDKFRTIQLDDSLAKLSRILEGHNYVIIKFAHDHYQNQEKRQNKTHIFGIITSIDLLEFIVKNDKSNESIKQNGFHQEAKSLSIIAKQSEALH